MIDVESIIYSAVATALRATFKPTKTEDLIFVSGEANAVPASFPAATLVEIDNSFYLPAKTLDGAETYSALVYQADAYSNRVPDKKAECKAIIALIDEEMHKLGFIRVGRTPVEMPDATKYRMTARYRAVISKTGVISRIV